MVRETLLVYLMIRRGPLVLRDMGLCARDVSRGITTLNRDNGSTPRPEIVPVINERSAPKFPVTARREIGVAV
jgi:hypothetical protein